MVQINQKVQLNICDMTVNGEGIGKLPDGYPLFVDGAITGDVVEAVVTKTNKTYGFARLLSIVASSEYRQEIICPCYKDCGGCNIMHISYEGQLKTKSNFVSSNLAKIGGYPDGSFKYEGIIGADRIYNYRNKAQFPVGIKNGRAVCGFYKNKTHEIVCCDNCSIQNEDINTAVSVVVEFINKYRISVYNEKNHKGIIRHIYVRSTNKGELMVVLVTNTDKKIQNSGELKDMLLKNVKLKSLVQNINTQKSNVVLGYTNITLWGDEQITTEINGIKFLVSPNSFFQVNYEQMQKLYQKAKEYASLDKTKTVFDLYCGVGSISLFMADSCKKVVGVEIVDAAIDNAKQNARLNKIDNAEFFCGDCGRAVENLVNNGYKADVVIVDPPRKGCDEKTLSLINSISPEKLVYVSCNSATLARDVAILKDYGYALKKACAVDLFPNSTHVECCVLLCRT